MGAKRMNLPCNMHEFTLLNARDSTAICCVLQGKMLELAMYLAPNSMIIRQKMMVLPFILVCLTTTHDSLTFIRF